ncbi:endonuclease [Marinobacter fuscus]|uniref:Endonuclease n=1 Tax=Marinobacter fuscus TaxID=2109942 RepID=A0A2T1KV63_9GAMM|nr:endonuclease [Marinobacter fuscus]
MIPARARAIALPGLLAVISASGLARADACGDAAMPIHQVQGQREQSPLAGKTVTVEGVMTLDTRYRGGFGGFYLQQSDATADDNPATSEGLFIYTRNNQGKVGEQVRVTGQIKEFHGLTEMVRVNSLKTCGTAPLPAPVPLTLPWHANPERFENMRVAFSQPLTIIDNYLLGRFGEITLAVTDPVIATEYAAPGSHNPAGAVEYDTITLDDGHSSRNPTAIAWLSTLSEARAGNQVQDLTGVLDYRFGQWRLQPEQAPGFIIRNPRPPAPEKGPGNLRIMSLNLQNYFNGNGQGDGFPTPRGADSLTAFNAQTQRLVRAVQMAAPDVLAVTELENDGYDEDSAAAELARALGASWRLVKTPGMDGSDAIRNVLLYRKDTVSPARPADRPAPGGFTYSGRPPLAQDFLVNGRGKPLRVVVTHFKSRSCRNASAKNRDQHDGQGCFNGRRIASAQAMMTWLSQVAAKAGSAPTLITGDFNSYSREQPIAHIESGGYTNLLPHFHPCTPAQCSHYSYRYRGRRGNLDHALASSSLLPNITRAVSWNINADEPPMTGYRQSPMQQGPWRASDHNPIIVDINTGL